MTEPADLTQEPLQPRKINWLAVGAIVSFACVFGFAAFIRPVAIAAFVLTFVLTFASFFLRGREMVSVFIAAALSMLLAIIAVITGLVMFSSYQNAQP